MDNRSDITKGLLTDCFKELMATMPFEKITIKTITDKAGLIRPTFYKHFQDKYEILEWIFQTEIADQTTLLIKNDMLFEAMLILCKGLEKDRTFYRKALRIEGTNSLKCVLNDYIFDMFLQIAGEHKLTLKNAPPYLTADKLAVFYTHSLIDFLEDWLYDDKACSAEEFCNTYHYLLYRAITDILSR